MRGDAGLLMRLLTSMARMFSIETASCAQKAAMSSSSEVEKLTPDSLLINWMTAMTSSRELWMG